MSMSATEATNAAAPQALRWWSASALTALSQRLDGCVREWAARWELRVEGTDVMNASEASTGMPEAPAAWSAWLGQPGSPSPCAWTGDMGEPMSRALCRALFGRSAEGTIAAEMSVHAREDLADSLSRRLGHAAASTAAELAPASRALWSGAAIVRLRLQGTETLTLWLRIDGDSVATLVRDLPRPTGAPFPALNAPVPVLAVLAHRTLTLRVELAPVVIDLGTLQSLRIGDVVPLPHRLDQPLEVRAQDETRLACLGYLGSRDGHRAIELIPSPADLQTASWADRPMNDSTSSRGDAPLAAHSIALNELHDIPTGTRPAITDVVNPLHNIRTRLQVCVGHVELTVGQLMSAKEHQVFVLNRLVDQPVDILLEGKVVARGQLVAVDDQFAVRLSEIPTPLKA
ncbi:flagellar motor switch protein FliN [Roseateles sp. YR242]|uniref:FliM/FliN family flagellar motor switch protein n=1 Tax=Roseateles sp. YR242 TaxID=1855305 RepID=UPI0008CCBF8F|nr:FliM/FliN family flagellar motor switch protein [Roseateles sp. YR242]SEK92877.1 flagellar motor switch protein FliN [Roseateles sp. YR242]